MNTTTPTPVAFLPSLPPLQGLDYRTAQGIPPSFVQTSPGRWVDCNSAEDAYYAATGRANLIPR